jgi:signal transduction histidine kinase
VYLLSRLRARVGAAERARVGRELHDGAIQTLIGAELEVHALRRRASTEAPGFDSDLQHIQELLRKEVLDLRDLMQQLRPAAIAPPDRFVDLIRNVVERFRRDTGISACFVAEEPPLEVSPRAALELVRITQEALVNVRKHSRARHVDVVLRQHDFGWRLSVTDDGTGFDFVGRLTATELDRRLAGPAIILERCRAIGAQLAVESNPGRGASVEIFIPRNAYA